MVEHGLREGHVGAIEQAGDLLGYPRLPLRIGACDTIGSSPGVTIRSRRALARIVVDIPGTGDVLGEAGLLGGECFHFARGRPLALFQLEVLLLLKRVGELFPLELTLTLTLCLCLQDHFAEVFLDFRDPRERPPLRHDRSRIAARADLLGRVVHRHASLAKQIDDLRRCSLGDQYFLHLLGLCAEQGLLVSHPEVFPLPERVVAVEIGVGEEVVLLEQAELRNFEREDEGEGLATATAAAAAAAAAAELHLDVFPERLDLDELDRRHRGGERARGDAVAAEPVGDDVVWLHAELIEIQRREDGSRPRLVEAVLRVGHAQARFAVDGDFQHEVAKPALRNGHRLQRHLLDRVGLRFGFRRLPLDRGLRRHERSGHRRRRRRHPLPGPRPDRQGAQVQNRQRRHERREGGHERGWPTAGRPGEERRRLLALGAGKRVVGGIEQGGGFEAIERRELVVEPQRQPRARPPAHDPKRDRGHDDARQPPGPPGRQPAPRGDFLRRRVHGPHDAQEGEKAGRGQDQGAGEVCPRALAAHESADGLLRGQRFHQGSVRQGSVRQGSVRQGSGFHDSGCGAVCEGQFHDKNGGA